MARVAKKLTDTWLKRASISNGIYGDGAGLYLRVQGSNRSWVYIYQGDGKRREMGLGAYPGIGLADARGKAEEARKVRATGGDPIAARDAAKISEQAERARLALEREHESTNTFNKVGLQYIGVKERGWSHDIVTKYKGYLSNHLTTLGAKGCGDITTGDIAQAIEPTWNTPTGPYLRSFIERILDFAMVKGICPERLNPARIQAVQQVLHDRSHKTKHHDAMPFRDVPAFVQGLQTLDTIQAKALIFCILTATRQLETRAATWSEFDPDLTLWTIPSTRYKTRVEGGHRVPIGPQARALLQSLQSNREPDALVFPGRLKGRPQSQHIFKGLLPKDIKPHGFRTSFVGWATKLGGFSDDNAQRCLGHLIGTAVTRSYDRDDRLDERRAMHDAWATYLFAGNS